MNFVAMQMIAAQRQQEFLREAQQERHAFLARHIDLPTAQKPVSKPISPSTPCPTC